MKSSQYSTFLLVLLAAILGSGVAVLAKVGLKEIAPLNFTFWRFLSALAVLLPILYLQKKRLTFAKFKKLFWILLFGAGNILIFIFGIRFTTASAAQVIYTFAPLFAGALSYFILGEKLGVRKSLGVILGFIGTLLIILLPAISGSSTINGNTIGNLLILLAVFSHSLYTVLSKSKQKEFLPIEITTYSVAFTLVLSMILMLIRSDSFGLPTANAVFPILYSGIVGTALFFLLYQYIIKNSSPLVASMVLYLEPIFTFVWAILLLSEKITAGLIAGMFLVFIGVYLASTAKKQIIMNNISA